MIEPKITGALVYTSDKDAEVVVDIINPIFPTIDVRLTRLYLGSTGSTTADIDNYKDCLKGIEEYKIYPNTNINSHKIPDLDNFRFKYSTK